MNDVSFEADLSDPHPENTIKQRKAKAAAPEPKKDVEPPKPPDAPEGDPLEEPAPETKPEPTTAPEPADKAPELLDENGKPVDRKKTSPWKLTEKLNAKNRDLMRELVELKEKMGKATNLEQELKRIETVEARNKELEEEIKYQNYSKSNEYTEKYQKPYEAAWAKAAKELAEIEVVDETGAVSRRANSQDLIALANMPLGQARKTANAMFGDSANDVMLHRQRIIDLSESQREALENSRKAGTDREQQFGVKQQAIAKEVGTLWKQSNDEAASKLEYLKPKEGDNDWNGALTKAQTMVDKAFSQSPADPNLTTEQRAALVKAHAAVRNRAIAYSTLKLENSKLRAQITERDAKLKAYEDSEPTAGNGSREAAQAQQPGDPMARAMARLQKSAVQAPNFF